MKTSSESRPLTINKSVAEILVIHARLENQNSDKPNRMTSAIPLPVIDIPAGTKLDIKLTKNTRAFGLRMLVANPLANA